MNPTETAFRWRATHQSKVEAAKLAARQSAPKHEEFTYEGCEVAE